MTEKCFLSSVSEQREIKTKKEKYVLFVGDEGVGKTTLIHQCLGKGLFLKFNNNYSSTKELRSKG